MYFKMFKISDLLHVIILYFIMVKEKWNQLTHHEKVKIRDVVMEMLSKLIYLSNRLFTQLHLLNYSTIFFQSN